MTFAPAFFLALGGLKMTCRPTSNDLEEAICKKTASGLALSLVRFWEEERLVPGS